MYVPEQKRRKPNASGVFIVLGSRHMGAPPKPLNQV